MRKRTKSVQLPNPKYRTTFDSAMPLSYIASHYPDVRKCSSGICNPRPGLTPGKALRAVGSGITSRQRVFHSGDVLQWRTLKYKVQTEIAVRKKEYYRTKVQHLKKGDCRKWWLVVNKLSSRIKFVCMYVCISEGY